MRRWQGRHPYLGGESACAKCRANDHAWTRAQTETFALPYGSIRLYHFSCSCAVCLLRCGAGLVHVDAFVDEEPTMEITFDEVPAEQRTALPVRPKGAHLGSFTIGSASEEPFSFFPSQQQGDDVEDPDGATLPDLRDPKEWPEVDADRMQQIVEKLREW